MNLVQTIVFSLMRRNRSETQLAAAGSDDNASDHLSGYSGSGESREVSMSSADSDVNDDMMKDPLDGTFTLDQVQVFSG